MKQITFSSAIFPILYFIKNETAKKNPFSLQKNLNFQRISLTKEVLYIYSNTFEWVVCYDNNIILFFIFQKCDGDY